MKLGLVGHGNMGKAVEKHALTQGHSIGVILDSKVNKLKELTTDDIDIVMDFSSQESALQNLEFYAANDLKVVMGTTGWNQHLEAVKELFNQSKGALIWSGNFSHGVMFYMEVLRYAAELSNQFKNYDATIYEHHHNRKADSPSGTGLMMGKILVETMDGKDTLLEEPLLNRLIEENEIHIASSRGGHDHGTHRVTLDSEVDSIELTHTARSKGGFALGAIECAKWLEDKQGYFEITDYINFIINKNNEKK